MLFFKTKRKPKPAEIIAVCIIAAFAVAFSSKLSKPAAVKVSASPSCENNEQRISFLSSYGIRTENEPFSVCDVIIPSSFDGMYQSFENVQNAQGLSLSEYKGQKVRRYSYKVTNPPNGFGETSAELLVQDTKLVGCALCDMQNKNGFSKIIG